MVRGRQGQAPQMNHDDCSDAGSILRSIPAIVGAQPAGYLCRINGVCVVVAQAAGMDDPGRHQP